MASSNHSAPDVTTGANGYYGPISVTFQVSVDLLELGMLLLSTEMVSILMERIPMRLLGLKVPLKLSLLHQLRIPPQDSK